MAQNDDLSRLRDAVEWSYNKERKLSIVGERSKSRFVESTGGTLLQTTDHTGVVEYQPDELVISVRAGTTLREIQQVLLERKQVLACDPPQFHGAGTIGGAVACGFSGPARPWVGSLRDAVLGVEMINGRGEVLNFGGKVMKNVAGFDISRLHCGACGTLGLLTFVNLRVHPQPVHEQSFAFDLEWTEAWDIMKKTLAQSMPVTATVYSDNQLRLRLSGSVDTISAALNQLPSGTEFDNTYWQDLRDQSLPFFTKDRRLWRAWINRGEEPFVGENLQALVEWAGAQIWYEGDELNNSQLAAFSDRLVEIGQPNPQPESKYTKRLRLAFDPKRILNSDLLV